MTSCFDRNGLASLDDLESTEATALLERLHCDQERFLAKESLFRSPEYPWPRDALHNWSRVWEYPYVMHNLEKLVGSPSGQSPRVLDVGSGVTFFPFSVAALGANVSCVDIDPVVEQDLKRAAQALDVGSDRFSASTYAGQQLPARDGEMDAVYCISVLEHVPQASELVREIARVLKAGGRFILTIDLAVSGRNAQIGPKEHAELLRSLEASFKPVHPDATIHPARVLTSDRGPYPIRSSGSAVRQTLRRVAIAALREGFGVERGILLACQGFVFERLA